MAKEFAETSQILETILSRLQKVKKSGDGWIACCPAHNDHHPSLKISIGNDGRVLLHCKAGCTVNKICTALRIAVKDLFPVKKTKHVLTIEELAQAKALPVEFLQSLGVQQSGNGVIIPYLDASGKPARQRKRTHVVAKEGSYWEGKGKIIPYGLWIMAQKDMLEEMAFVEGESDWWTLQYCGGYPALGIPGSQMPPVLEAGDIKGIERIYIIEESDKSGKDFVKKMLIRLAELGYKGEIYIVKMESTGVEDINDLYRKLGKEKFQEAYHNLLEQAIPVTIDKENLTELINQAKTPNDEGEKMLKPEPAQPQQKSQGKPKESPQIYRLDELQQKVFPPPRWAVRNILVSGLVILGGRPKMGKSALALNFALGIAYGGLVLGTIQVEQGDVFYLALEEGERRLQDRVQKMMIENTSTWPSSFYYATSWKRLDEGGLTDLEEWLKAHPDARLIIIDTLAKVRTPQRRGENIYEHDYFSMQGLKKLADKYNVVILVIHHTRKGEANDPLEDISGSFGLAGAVDEILVLKRERGKPDATLVITGREIEEKELALKFNFPHWEILGDAEEFRLSEERQAIIEILKEAGKALTPKEILALLKERGIKKTENSIYILLGRMTKNGEIKSEERGKYSFSKEEKGMTG